MPSTNGYGPKRAVLYARVSTDEQARSGYSLAQQLEALREYAACEGYEVLEEVKDAGQSGASLERPGMDRVRDLVAAGGVSVVLAQDRDRFSREPAFHYLLRKEFEEHDTKIRALNDRGDESPEGELTDGILDQLAKYERAKIAERSRRGKLRKAREGKMVAGPVPTYGFRYNDARDNYVVDERTMPVVRRIFYLIGVEGYSINAVKLAFDREGVPTPNGAAYWSHKAIRDCVLDDVYTPHTFEEISELVTPEVASRLDASKCYGIWWFNRRKTQTRHVSERGPDGIVYRKQTSATQKPKKEWIAVPVPGSDISREWVEAARDAIKDNQSTSSAARRTWSLSGGLFVCGVCGRSMTAMTTSRPNGKRYFYYRCPRRVQDGTAACSQAKYHVAEVVESDVWDLVRSVLTDPEQLRDDLERLIEQDQHSMRGDPEREVKTWLEKLYEVDRKRSGYIDLAADGIISRDELEAKLVRLEETRETAEKELKALRTRQERLEELQRDKDALLDYYAALAPDALDSLAPEERHRLYRMLRLKIVARPDETIELTGDLVSAAGVSKLEITYPSCSSRTRRGRRSAGRTLWARGSPMRRSRRPCLPPSRTSRRRPP
jgi:site-specific DNA recombinase